MKQKSILPFPGCCALQTICVFLGAFCVIVDSSAQPAHHIALNDFKNVRLPGVVLQSAQVAAENPGAPPFVQVKGTIGGTIRFELLLPDNWNGRFVMGGGGGFVGSVQNSARGSVYSGYATVGTDTGHESSGTSGAWAYNNIEAQLNFGYLAVHRTAEVAKALIRAYYGTDATYSFFLGCSRGGGQAMMESQRFPEDFDGIVAGAPAFDWTGLAANAVTSQKTLYPDPAHLDHTALDHAALEKLSKSILDQCDGQDGLKDGVVQDPPTANFDLSKVEGLTDAQRKSIEALYGGARDDKRLIYPGYTPGAECDPEQWTVWMVGPVPGMLPDHAPDLMFAFGTEIFKYLIFNSPDWDYSTYSFSHFATDTHLAASYLNATNANLDRLKSRKGKLILWHGWADPALPAQATINYYLQVKAHDSDAGSYCRLFMVPGCLHCGGGPGATEVDWLSVIVDWVERSHAPERVIASKSADGKVLKTRPLFNYPATARYKGSGDPNSADSFLAK